MRGGFSNSIMRIFSLLLVWQRSLKNMSRRGQKRMARTLDFLTRVFASRSCCFAKRVCRYTRRLILCLCCARNSHRCLGCLHFCLFGKERFVCLLRKHRVREKEQENC